VKLIIYGIAGQLLKTFSNPTSNINIADLPNGLYLFTIDKKNDSRAVVRVAKD